MIGNVREVNYSLACEFLMPKHYSGRKPNVMKAFGWYIEDKLVAVCTLGKPASHSLCVGVCGKQYAKHVIELNRLCRIEGLKEPLSQFLGAVLRSIRENYIVVSYSDMAMNHHGYIYQSCNFIYTGLTKGRTDKYTEGNKHSRHYDKNVKEVYRKVRSPKHRYVYFACPKRGGMKKEFLANLRYRQEPYPKGVNKHYVLGDFLKPDILKIKEGRNTNE